MKTGTRLLVTLAALLLCLQMSAQKPTAVTSSTVHGPEKGSLIIIGGGEVTPEIWDRFVELAGGKSAEIVVITNASGEEDDYHSTAIVELRNRLNYSFSVTRMHLKDIVEANDPEKIAPLKTATGIYFTGGRQWRIAEVYLNTLAHQEMWNLLQRGGVIAGSSAGASIQGSFLWRGDTLGPNILVGDHTQGLGFMKRTAIDQHILVRNRQHDLQNFIKASPDYIGIGIDESTAIEVHGDTFTVFGKSYVAIHHKGLEDFIFLRPGQQFDLKDLKTINTPAR
ncbi:MAG: cyanophycinase [Bacteroidales bacterium]|nr:cyanophycinase [Bacteroidales bacterium]